MDIAPISENEEARLAELRSLNLLDTLPEADYDDITHIAAFICDTPIALISLIDEKRQFFKSNRGLRVRETPRDYAFCAHAINTPEQLFVVSDAREDARFTDNPLVIGYPDVVFYAGMPLVTSYGHALGTLCVIDNDPRKLSDSQSEALKRLAKQVVNCFELRRANALLEDSKKTISSYAEQMENFASVAAHDIKDPVNAMSLLMDVIMRDYGGELGEEGTSLISMAKDSASQLLQLTDELMEYSRLGKVAEPYVDVDLNELLSAIEYLNSAVLRDTHGSIEADELPLVIAMKTPITTVLRNLIGNALKYRSPDRKPYVKVSVTQNDEFWNFSVSDNGIGMESQYLDSIFQVFKRLHTRDAITGTGLGLAMCKKAVELLGGRIWCESTPGVGSTFYFTVRKTKDSV